MKILFVFFLFTLTGIVESAAIYKWVDEKGVTHYSEMGPAKQKTQELYFPPAPPSNRTIAGKSWQEQERELRQRQVEKEEMEEQESKQRKSRQEGCESIRRELKRLEIPIPIYETNKKGERVYLDDKIRDITIAEMKEYLKTRCPL